MKISLTEKRINQIAEGLKKNKFIYAVSKDNKRVLFTPNGTVLYFSDIYPDLVEFLSGFKASERDYETILSSMEMYHKKYTIEYYSYTDLTQLDKIIITPPGSDKRFTCYKLRNGHVVNTKLFTGLSSRKFRYEQVKIDDKVSMIYVYSTVDETLTAIIFGLRGD